MPRSEGADRFYTYRLIQRMHNFDSRLRKIDSKNVDEPGTGDVVAGGLAATGLPVFNSRVDFLKC